MRKHLLTVGCFVAALVFYAAGDITSSAVLTFLGLVAETVVWIRVFWSQP